MWADHAQWTSSLWSYPPAGGFLLAGAPPAGAAVSDPPLSLSLTLLIVSWIALLIGLLWMAFVRLPPGVALFPPVVGLKMLLSGPSPPPTVLPMLELVILLVLGALPPLGAAKVLWVEASPKPPGSRPGGIEIAGPSRPSRPSAPVPAGPPTPPVAEAMAIAPPPQPPQPAIGASPPGPPAPPVAIPRDSAQPPKPPKPPIRVLSPPPPPLPPFAGRRPRALPPEPPPPPNTPPKPPFPPGPPKDKRAEGMKGKVVPSEPAPPPTPPLPPHRVPTPPFPPRPPVSTVRVVGRGMGKSGGWGMPIGAVQMPLPPVPPPPPIRPSPPSPPLASVGVPSGGGH